MQVTYFGTGAALNKNADTMHMKFSDGQTELFVDTGGGMSLMQRVLRKEELVQNLYLTHCHSDHLLGIAHLLRVIKQGILNIFCTEDLEKRIETLMSIVGQSRAYNKGRDEGRFIIHPIQKDSIFVIGDRTISPIDLFSKKDEQHGFMLTAHGKKLIFFGDEAVDILARKDLEVYMGADRLLCEAFCTHTEIDSRKPYDKQHITAQDAGTIATTLQAKNLILSHIDDYTDNRDLQLADMQSDAAETYSGNIIVPSDNQTIQLW